MKRIGQFLFLLIGFIIIAYAQPLLFPSKEENRVIPQEEETDVTVTHTSFPYGEIKATGLAQFIGKAPQELTSLYGEPLEIQKTSLGFEWWLIGENQADYLQVSVRQNVISSIFALGPALDLDPFVIGMDLADIAELTTIYSNFDFDYQKEHYKIELSEDDMTYRPLIAYDNDSFAVLHLNESTGQLIGVRYLNKRTLIELMPYQLNEGPLIEVTSQPETDLEVSNSDRQRQLHSILTILRQGDRLAPFDYLPELSAVATKSLTAFLAKPSLVLSDPQRLTALGTGLERTDFYHSFSLRQAEFDKFVTTSKIEGEGLHGIVYSPSYDLPFLAMTWYGKNQYQRQFTHTNDLGIGIAFKENMVFLLFAEQGKTQQETGDSNFSVRRENGQEESK